MIRPNGKCNQHILMVSNGPGYQDIFSNSLLPKCNGLHVTSFTDAQKICKKDKPHIIFLDDALPDAGAEKLIHEFYRNYPTALLILLINNTNHDICLRCWGKVDELLRKPITELQIRWMCEKYCITPPIRTATWRVALQYIIQRYSDPTLSEQGVAEELGLTPAYFSRLFKSRTGQSFTRKLHEIRIKSARELLQDHSLQIKEIAHRVGYQRVDSFIRCFHQVAGESPTNYRGRMKLNGIHSKLNHNGKQAN